MTATERYHVRSTCRLCGGADLRKVIPLNPLPVASPNVGMGAAVTDTAPADVWQCRSCGFLQLNTIIDPEFQYRNFRYVTGISLGLREHFKALIDQLRAAGEIAPAAFVFDIGSNDGSLLAYARDFAAKVLGIDPAEEIADRATKAGIPTIGDFFTSKQAAAIVAEHGQADVVISNNTVANVDDLDDLFAGIGTVLAPKGLVVIETQYALDVVEKILLDVIYHEHLSYFAVAPMQAFLAARGFELVDAERIAPKGGSIRFYIQHRGGGRPASARMNALIAAEQTAGLFGAALFDKFNGRIAQIGHDIRHRLADSKRATGRALAFGSSVGCAALVQYFDLGGQLDAVYDDTPLTSRIRTRKGDISVLSGAGLADEPVTDVLVLAWRYMSDIASRHARFVAGGGRFYRALPDLGYAAT